MWLKIIYSVYYTDYCRGNNKCVILQWFLNFDVISIKLENDKKKTFGKNEEKKKTEDEREREKNIKRRICVGE